MRTCGLTEVECLLDLVCYAGKRREVRRWPTGSTRTSSPRSRASMVRRRGGVRAALAALGEPYASEMADGVEIVDDGPSGP